MLAFDGGESAVNSTFHRSAIVSLIINHAGWICVAILAGYLVAGLWPLNFRPRNRLSWLPDPGGVRFERLSIAHGMGPLEFGSPAIPPEQAGSFSIELWLCSEIDAAHDIHSILSLYDGELPENLLVAQWRSAFLIRTVVLDSRGRRKYREAGIDNALPWGRTRFIALTSGAEGTSFYLDGVPARTYPKLRLRRDCLRGRLFLGNSPSGGPGWTGKLFGLAMFNRSLQAGDIRGHYQMWSDRRPQEIASEPGISALYLFDERGGSTIHDHSPARSTLVIPERYQVLHKTVLSPPWEDWARSLFHIRDIAVNIAGFVPFGFFYFVFRNRLSPGRGWRPAAMTLLAGGIISAAIELTQVYLPTRSSSLADLICNVAGTAGGVVTAWLVVRRWAISS